MSLPQSSLLRVSQRAMRQMADRDTPFIEDEWYVVALGGEIGRSLLKRTVLGHRLVRYRTLAGDPVALDDRCAHRSYPLSAGVLEGDTVVCGYHGMRYDTAGDCIEVPSQATCPRGIGVRRFPLVERGPFVWGWFGPERQADAARIPATSWVEGGQWTSSQDYFHLPGNYVSLHENLLDLTHLTFVHAGSFGTQDYARAPFQIESSEGRYRITRSVVPTRLPPVWAKPTGLEHDHAARIATSEFVAPGLHVVSVQFYDANLPPQGRPQFSTSDAAGIATPHKLDSSRSAAAASAEPPPIPLATGSRFSSTRCAPADTPAATASARAARSTRLSSPVSPSPNGPSTVSDSAGAASARSMSDAPANTTRLSSRWYPSGRRPTTWR